jgi:hypothetical protein
LLALTLALALAFYASSWQDSTYELLAKEHFVGNFGLRLTSRYFGKRFVIEQPDISAIIIHDHYAQWKRVDVPV